MQAVLITGAGRRIGAAIAEHLAQREWHVFVHYHASPDDADALAARIEAAGGSAETIQADLQDSGVAATLISKCTANAKHELTALINNAAAFEYDKPTSFDPKLFSALASVNLVAPVILAERFAAHVSSRGLKGCIINMLDQKLWNPNTDYYSYTLTKHALCGATELMAMAYAPHVRVCAIAPGLSLPSGDQTAGEFAESSRMNLTGAPVALADIAKTAEFILSTSSINAEIVFVDGGQHLVASGRDVMFVVRDKGGPK